MMLTFCIGTSGRKNRLSSFLVYSGNCLINLSTEEQYVLGFAAGVAPCLSHIPKVSVRHAPGGKAGPPLLPAPFPASSAYHESSSPAVDDKINFARASELALVIPAQQQLQKAAPLPFLYHHLFPLHSPLHLCLPRFLFSRIQSCSPPPFH